MQHPTEMLLAFILFVALYCKATAKDMDMVPDAMDDLYQGCRDEMLEWVLKSGLLRKELEQNKDFKKAWSPNTECAASIPGGLKEHSTALLAYAYGGREFQKAFNQAVETSGGNLSAPDFPFKSLHFLLTDTLRLLERGSCMTVYHVSRHKFTAQKGAEVRLGRFTVAFSDYNTMREDPDLEGGVLLKINSCHVVNVEEATCEEPDMELLLGPAEVFNVTEVKAVTEHGYDHTEISLQHVRRSSFHNCYLISRSPEASSTRMLAGIVMVHVAITGFFAI